MQQKDIRTPESHATPALSSLCGILVFGVDFVVIVVDVVVLLLWGGVQSHIHIKPNYS